MDRSHSFLLYKLYRAYLRSKPPDAIKIAISEYFHVSADYLVGLTDDPCMHSAPNHAFRLPPHFPPQAKAELNAFIITRFTHTNKGHPE